MASSQKALTGAQIYIDVCARCHGANGEGGIALALADAKFQAEHDNQSLIEIITQGREATPMIAWGEIFNSDQIEQVVRYIRSLQPIRVESTPGATPSFAQQLAPIFKDNCSFCHNDRTILGGWDASSYDSIMTTGAHGPVVTPGDPRTSLLAQKVRGLQFEGDIMPPGGLLPEEEIKLISDWIAAGAPNN